MAAYLMVSKQLWKDPALHRLGPVPLTPSTLYLHLVTRGHRGCLAGFFELGPAGLVDLNPSWTQAGVAEALAVLERERMVVVSSMPPVVFVPAAFMVQPPKGAKQVEGARKVLADVPSCPIVDLLMREILSKEADIEARVAAALDTLFQKSGTPIPTQGQDQDQGQEHRSGLPSSSHLSDAPPPRVASQAPPPPPSSAPGAIEVEVSLVDPQASLLPEPQKPKQPRKNSKAAAADRLYSLWLELADFEPRYKPKPGTAIHQKRLNRFKRFMVPPITEAVLARYIVACSEMPRWRCGRDGDDLFRGGPLKFLNDLEKVHDRATRYGCFDEPEAPSPGSTAGIRTGPGTAPAHRGGGSWSGLTDDGDDPEDDSLSPEWTAEWNYGNGVLLGPAALQLLISWVEGNGGDGCPRTDRAYWHLKGTGVAAHDWRTANDNHSAWEVIRSHENACRGGRFVWGEMVAAMKSRGLTPPTEQIARECLAAHMRRSGQRVTFEVDVSYIGPEVLEPGQLVGVAS